MPVVLVVEDEWLVRMEMADSLQESGWTVLEASNGEAGLRYLEHLPRVDLVVTDIRLPGRVSGWDVADAFRGADSGVAVIYCSGNPADAKRTLTGSVFLSKPCRMSTLTETAALLYAAARGGPPS